MSKPVRILGIAGSLRRDSYNRATLRAAMELAPEGAFVWQRSAPEEHNVYSFAL